MFAVKILILNTQMSDPTEDILSHCEFHCNHNTKKDKRGLCTNVSFIYLHIFVQYFFILGPGYDLRCPLVHIKCSYSCPY